MTCLTGERDFSGARIGGGGDGVGQSVDLRPSRRRRPTFQWKERSVGGGRVTSVVSTRRRFWTGAPRVCTETTVDTILVFRPQKGGILKGYG